MPCKSYTLSFVNSIFVTLFVFILQVMVMKNIGIRTGIFSLLLFCVACGSSKRAGKAFTKMPGTWQTQPIVIDGDCTDWPSPYPNYDAKAMVAYATSNDRENLYVTMQTGDALTQIKILKQGMTVSIDTGGRKDPGFNINFPLQNDDDLSELLMRGDGQKGGGSTHLGRQFEQKLRKSAEGSTQFSLDGFGSCNGGFLVSQTTSCGVKVKLSIDEYKQLVWEAVIPFKAIYDMDRINSSFSGKAISVCFAVKAFKSPSAKGGDNNAAPMNNNMGGGMGGGGMAGGGRLNSTPMGPTSTSPGKDNPMQRLYESSKTWKHFSIAWQQ